VAPRLSKILGADVAIASETFQHTGSFKFRAAYNVALNVPQREIIAASSGNFGQGLAYACQLLGKDCTVVMPDSSAKVKIDAIREYGGRVDLINIRHISRADRVTRLINESPEAYRASAYDDPLVIEGNSTLGEELAALDKKFDYILVPIGGGGLASGLVEGFTRSGYAAKVVGAEPQMANDAARSLRAGRLLENQGEPRTIADGARTVSLGQHNWEILKEGLAGIVEVSEDQIAEGVRLLYRYANLKAEPTGALSIGALLAMATQFRGKSVCCIVTGGNVDAEIYKRLLE
jgi:threonine dehydratase